MTIILSIIFILNSPSVTATTESLKGLNVKEIILPSEVSSLGKSVGSIYYNKSTKGKVLVPVNFWGEVSKSGLHFIPAETNFISGLSMAGGPNSNSKLSNVKILRKIDTKIKTYEFDLTEGGNQLAYDFKLRPNDTVFVERSTFYQDRTYYTSLVNVAVSVLSAILISQQIQNQN